MESSKSSFPESAVAEHSVTPRTVLSCDVAIIGGGGGGMALLWALAQQGYLDDHRVVLIEPQAKDTHDRTWCFWARTDDPKLQRLRPCISHQWTEARAEGRIDDLGPYAYFQVRSADFYTRVKSELNPKANFQWIREAVDSTQNIAGGHIALGTRDIHAQQVYDSRITALSERPPNIALWQSFVGWRIRTSKASFSPQRMELMNFEVPQNGETQFIYFLPTAEDEMLIELTRFGREHIDVDWGEAYLHVWLRRTVGSYEVLETETGAIPMSQALDASKKKHPKTAGNIPIGTAAGAVKPTTGYAFYQMLEHGEALARAIQNNQAAPTIYRAPRYRFYDRLLLDILAKEPEKGRPIFKQLFRRTSTPTILQFLGERTPLRKEIPLLLSLPVGPFLRALDRQYLRSSVQSLIQVFDPRRLQQHLALWMGVILVGLQWFAPSATQAVALPLLLGGLIFPGIPHGAMDHVLGGSAPRTPARWIKFIALYLVIMAAILALWWASPTVGLLSFLGYSAWHFGETDCKHWDVYSPVTAWIYGSSLLGVILLSHPEALTAYVHALGLSGFDVEPFMRALPAFVIGLTLPLFRLQAHRLRSYFFTLVVLLIGLALPLLLAFALYFVGLHSWRAWRHLRRGLQRSDWELMRAAAPFSLAAYVFIVAFIVAITTFDLPFEGVASALFLFLAAVSAPHIWMMHGFYRK